jgi:putative spermidine/putrescine transport system permease protein
MSRNGPLSLAFHGLFVAFMLAPIILVCLVAFTPEGYLSLPVNGFSLRWFSAILAYPEIFNAFATSLWLAAVSSTLAVVAAGAAAIAIARYRFLGRNTITALFLSPLVVPHVVLGIAFLRFFSVVGLSGTATGLVISHLIVIFPFALRLTLASATGLDRAYENAAASLGAGRFTVLRRIVLPLILPGIAAGWVLSMIQSFDEVTMTVFIASPTTTTLPVWMFNYIQSNIDPLICAVSALLIVFTVALTLVLDRLYGLERLFGGAGH